jgi:hypothetical protein
MKDGRPKIDHAIRRGQRGYLIVLFVIIVAFVGVVAAMQALVLTSVATTSRAYDSYRQGTTERARLERAVAEAVFDQRQISVAEVSEPLSASLNVRLQNLCVGGATVAISSAPESLPQVSTFPDSASVPDAISNAPSEITQLLTPELAMLAGPRFATYPAADFEFSSERSVLETTRVYKTRVRAQLIAVPLTRFAIAAYDLPAEIGSTAFHPPAAPASALPAGVVPSRDDSFIADLQRQPHVLPYHYRRRAALSAAYQYVFSQRFIDRVAEYAGITHFRNLDANGSTATLAGMTQMGSVATWDLGLAGNGTYGTITMAKDAAVVFTEQTGQTLQLRDTVGSSSASPMLVLILGPSSSVSGPIVVDLGTISRPVVVIGYNVRITAPAGTAFNGALLLDPSSSMATSGPLTVGHLSYWAGTTTIPQNAAVAGAMPLAAEAIAPRVVYVATQATRL